VYGMQYFSKCFSWGFRGLSIWLIMVCIASHHFICKNFPPLSFPLYEVPASDHCMCMYMVYSTFQNLSPQIKFSPTVEHSICIFNMPLVSCLIFVDLVNYYSLNFGNICGLGHRLSLMQFHKNLHTPGPAFAQWYIKM
jgi:hypothetical protein